MTSDESIDLISDFIPVLGYLTMCSSCLRCGTDGRIYSEGRIDQCREESDGLWKDGRTKKWCYVLHIVLIWGLLNLAAVVPDHVSDHR